MYNGIVAVFLLFIGVILLVNGIIQNIFGLIIGGAVNVIIGAIFLFVALCRAKSYNRTINSVPRPVPALTTTVAGQTPTSYGGYGLAPGQGVAQNQVPVYTSASFGNQVGVPPNLYTHPYQNNTNPPYPVAPSPYPGTPSEPPYPSSPQPPYPPVNNDPAPAYTFSTSVAPPPPSYESVTKEKL